jgi:hypothetical protein
MGTELIHSFQKLNLVCLREEHRPRVSENRVLREIFGPEKEEVAEG